MYDDDEETVIEEPEELPVEEEPSAANQAGQLAGRTAANVYTGGRYEKIRRAPVVGGMVQKAERKIGDTVEKIDRQTGGKINRQAERIKNRVIKPQNSPSENNESTTGISSIVDRENNISSKTTFVKAMKNPVTRKIILIGLGALLIVLLIVLVAAALAGDDYKSGIATSGYYAMRCPEVTVIKMHKNKTSEGTTYEPIGTYTYPLEEYVAGVVAGEVAFLGSLEVDKEFAIAARTYLLTHDDNCVIESSDRKQVFRELTDSPNDQLARQAAEETKGQVLLSNNELYSVGYDAFCSIAVDDNYYTIKQANQKIPRSWVDSQRGIAESWKQGTCAGNHGRGLSQWGSLYLATEQGYTYTELLKFYLGDEITISSGGFMSSIPGLEIKDTTNATELHESLSTYLPSKGTSVEELNTFIKNNVIANGVGTREGVVTAAVSLVNYLYDGMNVRIPYYWGGNYQNIGVNPSFGGQTSPRTSKYGSTFYYSGLDCSGFASWAIRNGGYNFSRQTTQGFHSKFAGDSCDIKDSNCIGQPGDLINSQSCHVQMIVSVDEASGTYYVAESTGKYGVIMRPWKMHSSNCGNETTRILHMDNFYNNQSNVDTNY